MRVHLVTVESVERFGEQWRIAPLIPLGSLPKNIMMPMKGDEVELRLPDGGMKSGHIVGFGMGAWKGSDGKFYTNVDPYDPDLTLTITGDADLTELPPGTEIWLPDAKFASA